jgi:hypothetical protein
VQDGTGLRRGGATAILVAIALLGALALPTSAPAVDTIVESDLNGSLAATPTQTGAVNVVAGSSTCGSQKANPGASATGARPYHSYTHTNITNGPICFTVDFDAGVGTCGPDELFNVSYLDLFDPAAPSLHYLADPGETSDGMGDEVNSSFSVPAGSTFVDVVAAVDVGTTCTGYLYILHADRPFAFSPPTITGTPAVNSGLGGSTGDWTNPHTFTQQWLRCNASGGVCTDIPGATALGYLPTASDVGSTLRLRVTADDGPDTSSADSAPTGVVAPAPATTPQQSLGGKGNAAKKCKKKGKKSSVFAAKKKGCKKKKKR